MHACFHSILINRTCLCEMVQTYCLHNKCMSLSGKYTNYRISLVLWAPFSLKTLLEDSSLHKPDMSSKWLKLQGNFFM